MKGKGSYHHSEACATGYVGVETAVALVASGEYDMVLSVVSRHRIPSHIRPE